MNEKILEEILENTKAVKVVVVEKEEKLQKAKSEKAEKAKSAKQRAESKFTKIGTKLNESELEIFQAKLEAVGKNQSQYIKQLISFDLVANEELIKRQEQSITEWKNVSDNQLANMELVAEDNNIKIKTLEDTISSLKVQLDKELTKSFMDKIRALF